MSILDLMHSAGKRSVLVDHSDTLNKCMRGQTAAIVARTNEEVLAKAKAQVREQALTRHQHGEGRLSVALAQQMTIRSRSHSRWR